MAIMTPENLIENLNNSLKSVINFDEKITIATDNGNAILINIERYNKLISILKHLRLTNH